MLTVEVPGTEVHKKKPMAGFKSGCDFKNIFAALVRRGLQLYMLKI